MNHNVHIRLYPKNRGFSLVELLVGAVVFLGISVGAYKVFTSTTKTASTTQQTTKQTRQQKQFFARFRNQIENTLQLPNSDGTRLRVKRPDRCAATDSVDDIGWSLQPFPGRTSSEIPTNFNPIDPSSALNSSDESDGIRMVYITQDSVINRLKLSGAVAQPTIGVNTSIVLEGAAQNLAIGDFAVISDAFRKDLIRITNITMVGGNAHIEHDSTKSIWNAPDLLHNYGGLLGEYGQPVLFKVAVATYALDSVNNNLMVDNHVGDDDFAPPSTWSAGLRQKWQVASGDVSKFKILYDVGNEETRTPQAGIPGREYSPCTGSNDRQDCGCANQLGTPDIKSIRIEIEFAKAGSTSAETKVAVDSESFNPAVLKKDLPSFGVATNGGCDGDILFRTNSDGTPNTKCENPACLCTDLVSGTCTPPACGTQTGGGGWGTGGTNG
jgi:prepilin-type N-terminal cleavage/methylation domain-containing protein